MTKSSAFSTILDQLLAIINAMRATPKFIVDHKLWVSVKEQRGVLIFAICVSFLFTYLLYGDVSEFMHGYFGNSIPENPNPELVDQSNLIDVKSIERPKLSEMFSSSTKFMLMVLLEVVIFSFSVKTLNILRNQNRILGVKDFWRAEKRMLLVMLFSFIAGVVILVLTKIALGILGAGFLAPTVMFFVYAYILGYAFFDNFNEQFGFEIKASRDIIWQHKGAALGLGIVATILLFIPLLGALIVPVGGGIAATIYAHEHNMELTKV